MINDLTGYTPEDEQLVAAHVAAFVEYHFEAMHIEGGFGSLRVMSTLQLVYQIAQATPDVIINPVYLETIETALQHWSTQQSDFKPLFDKNPQGALLICVATFFRFYEELLDGVAAVIQAGSGLQDMLNNIPDDIHTTSDTPKYPLRNRAKIGRKAKNQQHNRRQ